MASSHGSASAPGITPISDLLIPNSSREAGEGAESALSKPDWDLMWGQWVFVHWVVWGKEEQIRQTWQKYLAPAWGCGGENKIRKELIVQ